MLRTLVNSLCPAIYGHELVKAGLLLGLFGGSQKYASDKDRIPVYTPVMTSVTTQLAPPCFMYDTRSYVYSQIYIHGRSGVTPTF